jgi:hypothetical protein
MYNKVVFSFEIWERKNYAKTKRWPKRVVKHRAKIHGPVLGACRPCFQCLPTMTMATLQPVLIPPLSRTPSPLPPTTPAHPVAPYPPTSAPEERSRAPEFYGFVAWTSTCLLFVLYLIWGLFPGSALQAAGITWYPNRCVVICCNSTCLALLAHRGRREWAILLPAYSVMLVLMTYAAYFALALMRTPSFNELCTITGMSACVHRSESHH